MQLEQSFSIPVPVKDAWRVLLDIEQVSSCMPGAAVDSVDGDEFTGVVKVKLGPISLTYAGKASFAEKDEAAHRVVINAQGKDRRGNGTAAAVVSAQLTPEGEATRVDVVTDLNITGRPAQFGRGAMNDVADKLLGQFADQLTARLAGAPEVATPAATAEPAAATEPQSRQEPEPIDLAGLVAGSVGDRLRRPARAALVVLLLALCGFVIRRRLR